jgi:two-component system sensor histidine kinase/response regulator
MEKIKVLYIDDEVNNLNAFKAAFRQFYNISIAQSAKEGLSILESNEIHVIIADQRMPETTGVDFFESIIKQFPDPIRILLTGYADIEAVIGAINKGQVYRYIKKPWDDFELKMNIENAFEIYYTRKELKLKNEALIKANNELNRFVYSASHDLKAPLVTILGILKVAEIERKNKDTYEYFIMIEECVRKLEIFIKNIINYYKNVRLDRDLNKINFEKIIKETIEGYHYYEDTSNINFKIDIDQNEDFLSDEFRIRVITNNILSNSIKYQKEHSTEKTISIEVKKEGENTIMSFADNGIGIPKEYIDDIFKMFFRATSQSTGSGIGLYIVKEAVDKINGEISVDTTEGKALNSLLKFQIKLTKKRRLKSRDF